MASQGLSEPLLARPKPSKPIGSVATVCLNTLLLIVVYLLIKENPVCDQPLILWMQWLFTVLAGGVLVEMLKCRSETTTLALGLRVLLILAGLGMWVWGHWPVYESEMCEEALWSFVFGFELVVDVGVGLGVLVCCCVIYEVVLRPTEDSNLGIQ